MKNIIVQLRINNIPIDLFSAKNYELFVWNFRLWIWENWHYGACVAISNITPSDAMIFGYKRRVK